MDAGHSRYLVTGMGDINGPLRLEDRRPEGSSWYVRTEDLETVAANREAVRLGPEALVDILPSGRPRAARHAFTGGEDTNALPGDSVYIGTGAADPPNHTRVHTLEKNHGNPHIALAGHPPPD